MEFLKEITLRDGRSCLLRNALPEDAAAFNDYFDLAHSETDFLTTYPGERPHSNEDTARSLEQTRLSSGAVEICAFVDGVLAGSGGIDRIRDRVKLRHRAEFGISIIREYWGLGIGGELLKCCIECAEKAGYRQLELQVVGDNASAVRLYERFGFTEFGRNPRGFLTRDGRWQELVLMRLELNG